MSGTKKEKKSEIDLNNEQTKNSRESSETALSPKIKVIAQNLAATAQSLKEDSSTSETENTSENDAEFGAEDAPETIDEENPEYSDGFRVFSEKNMEDAVDAVNFWKRHNNVEIVSYQAGTADKTGRAWVLVYYKEAEQESGSGQDGTDKAENADEKPEEPKADAQGQPHNH